MFHNTRVDFEVSVKIGGKGNGHKEAQEVRKVSIFCAFLWLFPPAVVLIWDS